MSAVAAVETTSQALTKIRAEYSAVVKLLKTQKLRQSIEFNIARFEADLLTLEALADEARSPSDPAGNSAGSIKEAVSRLLPPLTLKFRGLVLELQREKLRVPEGALDRVGELERTITAAGQPARTAAEAVLGL